MKSSNPHPNQSSALAGDSTAAADVSTIKGTESPTVPCFFIRADGQYFFGRVVAVTELWTVGGKPLMKTLVQKYEFAVLGYFPDGTATILRLEESFFN